MPEYLQANHSLVLQCATSLGAVITHAKRKIMISYITLGSNDLAASATFFDALFCAINGTRAFSLDNMIAYSFGPEKPKIIVTTPYDGETAFHGNGTMVALAAKDQDQVDAVHALAIELGATDEGAPGNRGKHFYGGYFRDPDGNKFNISLTV
ncbi:putative lactoylglutathione lyase [Labrenzia sp. EL_142]|nr:putative lactoylglutathione lyase [Labrenzia sp. EL_142]